MFILHIQWASFIVHSIKLAIKADTVLLVIFGGITFRDKLKEVSRISFHSVNFRDCHAVGHGHQNSLVLVCVHKLVGINFSLMENFMTAELATKITKKKTTQVN